MIQYSTTLAREKEKEKDKEIRKEWKGKNFVIRTMR
jgi:hypothetical protein